MRRLRLALSERHGERAFKVSNAAMCGCLARVHVALTWIKGEAMPGELVDEILRGLRLERETDEQRRQRLSLRYRLMAR